MCIRDSGVVYDFIDNDEFFSWGNPYTNLIDDIPKSVSYTHLDVYKRQSLLLVHKQKEIYFW